MLKLAMKILKMLLQTIGMASFLTPWAAPSVAGIYVRHSQTQGIRILLILLSLFHLARLEP